MAEIVAVREAHRRVEAASSRHRLSSSALAARGRIVQSAVQIRAVRRMVDPLAARIRQRPRVDRMASSVPSRGLAPSVTPAASSAVVHRMEATAKAEIVKEEIGEAIAAPTVTDPSALARAAVAVETNRHARSS